VIESKKWDFRRYRCVSSQWDLLSTVTDKAITEPNDGFSEEDMKILRTFRALTPVNEICLNGDVLAASANNYKDNTDDANLELRQILSRTIDKKRTKRYYAEGDKLIGFARFLHSIMKISLIWIRLTQIACTLPGTFVLSESSFSVSN